MFHLKGGKLRKNADSIWDRLSPEQEGLDLFFCHQRAKLSPKRGIQKGSNFCSEKSKMI